MGKNVMFVKSGNMANMNFLDLLEQYPFWTSLVLLTVFGKVLMDFLTFSRWILSKTFTVSPVMFKEYIS
jgi:hypothetical protein